MDTPGLQWHVSVIYASGGTFSDYALHIKEAMIIVLRTPLASYSLYQHGLYATRYVRAVYRYVLVLITRRKHNYNQLRTVKRSEAELRAPVNAIDAFASSFFCLT